MRDDIFVPYRTALTKPAEPDEHERSMFVVGAVFWAASVSRIVFAFATHETFGAVTTLAFCAVVVLPLLAITSLRRSARRAR